MYWIITPDWLEDELEDGFEQLADTHKMTLFSKKIKKNPQNLKEADGTNFSIMKYLLFYIYHLLFSLEWTEHAFFNLII